MKYWKLFSLLIVLALLVSGCGIIPGTGNNDMDDAMMDPTATSEAIDDMADSPMDDKMMETAAPETMDEMATEVPVEDPMMEETAATEAMDDMPADDSMDDSTMEQTAVPDVMMEDDEMMATETPGMEDDMPGDSMMPAWLSASLDDVSTGEMFSLQDYQGKVLLVDLFSVECPNCLSQQREIAALHEALVIRDNFASVSLAVGPGDNAAGVETYLEEHGFSWLFAVAPPDVVAELGSLYGEEFLDLTSAPVLLVDQAGEVHALEAGVKSAAELQEEVEVLLDGEM